MTKKEKLAFIAGLVEGEGCISISRFGGHHRFGLRVSITNTNLGLLESVRKDLKIGRIYPKGISKISKYKLYQYIVTSNQALLVLKKLLSFLRAKKEEAVLGIKFQEDKNKFTSLNHYQQLPQKVISEREKVYLEMRSLKSVRKVRI